MTEQHEDGRWTYIIPRGFHGGTIIGGTREPNEWSTEPDIETREAFLKRAGERSPWVLNEKGGFDVLTDIVGRRPSRQGGVRIELERKADEKNIKRIVLHAYGAGGRGYETSWGIAEEVKELARSVLK